MAAKAKPRRGHRTSYWAWPGPADIYVMVPVAVAAFLAAHFFGKSEFAMSVTAALMICTWLAYAALGGKDLDKWTPFLAWVIRAAAAVTGWWLFTAAPTLAGRFAAVILYAALYVLCEWAVWRRVRAEQNANHNFAT
ncbi:MAG: hypothetical protein WAM66_03790 [Acidobacteriaceae bacterium]